MFMKVRIEDYDGMVTLVRVDGPDEEIGMIVESGFEDADDARLYAIPRGWEVVE
jgi:hypothetical protein